MRMGVFLSKYLVVTLCGLVFDIQITEDDYNDLVRQLSDKNPTIRGRVFNKLVGCWEADDILDLISRSIESAKQDGNSFLTEILSQIKTCIINRKELGSELVEIFTDKVDEMCSWSEDFLVLFFTRQINQHMGGLVKDTKTCEVFAKWLFGRLKSHSAKRNFIDAIGDNFLDKSPLQIPNGKELLVKLLKDTDTKVKASALGTLYRMDVRDPYKEIVDLTKDSEPMIRLSSARYLVRADAEKFGDKLAGLLNDELLYIRMLAVEKIAENGLKQYSGQIAVLLDERLYTDYKPIEKKFAIIGDIEKIFGGVNALKKSAIAALGTLGSKEFVKEVGNFLKHDNISLRLEAMRSLAKLRAFEYIPEIGSFLKHNEIQLRVEAIKFLGELGAVEYIDEMVIILQSENHYDIQLEAVRSLHLFGAKEYIEQYIDSTKKLDTDSITTLLTILGDVKAREFSNFAVECLADEKCRVRAIRTLGDMGIKRHAKDIAIYLRDSSAEVRIATIEELGSLDAVEYTKEIAELVSDETVVSSGWLHSPPKIVKECALKVLKKWNVDIKQLQKENKTK
ncbi:MAG: HEAT repeat domain-containing protein [Planctomycetes bacterium]|nr:HEAT repeat domain-containing protein [Planctomycetota bacterium]